MYQVPSSSKHSHCIIISLKTVYGKVTTKERKMWWMWMEHLCSLSPPAPHLHGSRATCSISGWLASHLLPQYHSHPSHHFPPPASLTASPCTCFPVSSSQTLTILFFKLKLPFLFTDLVSRNSSFLFFFFFFQLPYQHVQHQLPFTSPFHLTSWAIHMRARTTLCVCPRLGASCLFSRLSLPHHPDH